MTPLVLEVQAEPTGLSTYRFEIVPELWLLTRPPLRTPHPRARVQTARVAGPIGEAIHIGDTKIVIEAAVEVTVKAGDGSFVDIDAGGNVFIVGPHVWINDKGAPEDLPPPGPRRPERPETAAVMDPGKATDTLTLAWPDALTAHLPPDLALRLDLGERSTSLPWSEGTVQDGRRHFAFEHVPLGTVCTLVAVAGGAELRLWDGQRANDPDDPPVFTGWVEDLVVRDPPPQGRIVNLGPMSTN